MKHRLILTIVLLMILVLFTPVLYAATITADTTGENNFYDEDFYGVSYLSGTEYIESVSFDITVDLDAYFDFNGGATYANASDPVMGIPLRINHQRYRLGILWQS